MADRQLVITLSARDLASLTLDKVKEKIKQVRQEAEKPAKGGGFFDRLKEMNAGGGGALGQLSRMARGGGAAIGAFMVARTLAQFAQNLEQSAEARARGEVGMGGFESFARSIPIFDQIGQASDSFQNWRYDVAHIRADAERIEKSVDHTRRRLASFKSLNEEFARAVRQGEIANYPPGTQIRSRLDADLEEVKAFRKRIGEQESGYTPRQFQEWTRQADLLEAQARQRARLGSARASRAMDFSVAGGALSMLRTDLELGRNVRGGRRRLDLAEIGLTYAGRRAEIGDLLLDHDLTTQQRQTLLRGREALDAQEKLARAIAMRPPQGGAVAGLSAGGRFLSGYVERSAETITIDPTIRALQKNTASADALLTKLESLITELRGRSKGSSLGVANLRPPGR